MGRVALVSGGGSGIGRATAVLLAGRGHTLVVTDRDLEGARATAGEIEAAGGAASARELDVTDPDEVHAVTEQVTGEVGPVEVLVNAAGWDEFVAFVETDEAFWRRVVEVNYLGVLRLCHALVPAMVDRGWGRVVNIGSDAGRVGSSLESVYAGTKAGVIAFTKSLAREVARDGITCNVVCPGPTDTPLIRAMAERRSDGDRFLEALARAVPMRRLARPDEVATAVAFFAGEETGYVTGQTLSVSGGLTMA